MKIFKYELKIILAKAYVPAMTVIALLYAWFLLSSETILGVSDTAPFSGWSFGTYLGSTVLISMLISLFLLANAYSERQKRVEILTDVTGFPTKHRMLVKSGIIGGYFLVLNLLFLILGCVFLMIFFGRIHLITYLAEYLLISLPCLFVILGMGNCLGRIHRNLICLFMGAILILDFVAPTLSVDANGAHYYKAMSAALETMNGQETPFVWKASYLLSRLAYLLVGIATWVISLNRLEKKKKWTS